MSKLQTGITRRDFVKQATAAAALPIIATAPVLADGDKKVSANERITLGFIGVGKQNGGHLRSFARMNEVQVLAVCDVDTTRRDNAKSIVDKAYAEKIKSGTSKACDAYNDFNELIARKDIDAVVIATPDHWHTIPALLACKEKKDVYCEKPLTLTIHEAKLLIDTVRKYERVFQTGSQQRSDNPEFRQACELVRNGRLGKLKTVNVHVGPSSKWCDLPEDKMEPGLDWERWLGPAPLRPYNAILSPRGVHNNFPDWRNYREYSGGMMTDWGAHHYDITQWALDMDESGPTEIIPPDDPKAQYGLRYLYANGVEVVHKPGNNIVFVGTDGEITVNRGRISSKPESILKEPLGEKDVRLYKSPGHHREWLNCLRSRKKPNCDVEIGARSVTVCHLGNLAYWNHKKLKWDAKSWKFIDDAEANKWLDRERRGTYQLPKV